MSILNKSCLFCCLLLLCLIKPILICCERSKVLKVPAWSAEKLLLQLHMGNVQFAMSTFIKKSGLMKNLNLIDWTRKGKYVKLQYKLMNLFPYNCKAENIMVSYCQAVWLVYMFQMIPSNFFAWYNFRFLKSVQILMKNVFGFLQNFDMTHFDIFLCKSCQNDSLHKSVYTYLE